MFLFALPLAVGTMTAKGLLLLMNGNCAHLGVHLQIIVGRMLNEVVSD